MTTSIGELEGKIKLDDEFSSTMSRIVGEFRRHGVDLSRVGSNISKSVIPSIDGLTKAAAGAIGAVISIQALGRGIAAVTTAAAEAEENLAGLTQAVRAKGIAARTTTEDLVAMSAELQRSTRFSDDAIQQAQTILLRYNSIDGSNIERITRLTLDLAQATGQELAGAARSLGRALDEPGEGLRALAQAGIVLEDSQKKMLKAFEDSGREVRGQQMILGLLEAKIKGVASEASTLGLGPLTQLKNTFGDLAEILGGPFLQGLQDGAQSLSNMGRDQSTVETMKSLGESLGVISSVLADMVRLADSAGATRLIELITKAGSGSLLKGAAEFNAFGMADRRREAIRNFAGPGNFEKTAIQEAESQLAVARAKDEASRSAERLAVFQDRLARLQEKGKKALDHLVDGYKDLDRVETEAAKNAAELAALLAKYDPHRSEIEELEEAHARLSAEVAKGGAHAIRFKRSLEEVEDKLRQLKGPLQSIFDILRNPDGGTDNQHGINVLKFEIPPRVFADLQGLKEDYHDVTIEAKTLNEEIEEMRAGWEPIVNLLGEYNSDLGSALQSVVNIAAEWKKINQEGASAQQKLEGYAGMAQGIADLGRSMGWWGPEGGTSQFGGSKDRNYAAEGQAVGAVLGFVIGGILGAGAFSVATAQAGAAIGGVIGEIVGSMIKSGAAEGLANLKMGANGLMTEVKKNEEGLGEVVGEFGQRIIDGLNQAVAALNAEFTSIPDVKIKVRGEHVSVLIGGVYAWFKSMEEAVSFAMAEILRQSELSGGISDNVRNAIANSTSDSVDQLMSDIEFAIKLDQVNMSDVEIAVSEFMTEYRAAITRATQLGLDTSAVGGMLGNNLQSLRDQILGIVEDPRKAVERKAAAFNAEIQLIQAEQMAKIAELKFKEQILIADLGLTREQMNIDRAALEARKSFVEIEGGLAKAEFGLVGAMFGSLLAVQNAIKAAEALLANLPALISGEEIGRAMSRIGGGRSMGGVSNWHQRMLSALEGIRDLQKRLVFGSLSPFTGAEKVSFAQAEVERLRAMYGQGGRSKILAMEQLPEAIETFLELFQSTYGGTGEFEMVSREMNDFLSSILRQHGMSPITQFQQQAAASADAIARKFQFDSRGNMRIRDEEGERNSIRGNELAHQTATGVARMVGLLEDMNANVRSAVKPPPTPSMSATG